MGRNGLTFIGVCVFTGSKHLENNLDKLRRLIYVKYSIMVLKKKARPVNLLQIPIQAFSVKPFHFN